MLWETGTRSSWKGSLEAEGAKQACMPPAVGCGGLAVPSCLRLLPLPVTLRLWCGILAKPPPCINNRRLQQFSGEALLWLYFSAARQFQGLFKRSASITVAPGVLSGVARVCRLLPAQAF